MLASDARREAASLAGVEARGTALSVRLVEERLAMMDLMMAEAFVTATFERRAGRISARGAGVQRRALEDSRLRFLGLLT